MVVVHSTNKSEDIPPINQNCKYQIKIATGTFQCYTAQEYDQLQVESQQRQEMARQRLIVFWDNYWWAIIGIIILLIVGAHYFLTKDTYL